MNWSFDVKLWMLWMKHNTYLSICSSWTYTISHVVFSFHIQLYNHFGRNTSNLFKSFFHIDHPITFIRIFQYANLVLPREEHCVRHLTINDLTNSCTSRIVSQIFKVPSVKVIQPNLATTLCEWHFYSPYLLFHELQMMPFWFGHNQFIANTWLP